MADKQKSFTFTNENLYDQNVFSRLYPDFLQALSDNDNSKLFKSVQGYYFITQHFYQNKAEEIGKLIVSASEKLDTSQRVKTEKQRIQQIKKKQEAKILLLQAWTKISNELHAKNYFKRSMQEMVTSDNDRSSLL